MNTLPFYLYHSATRFGTGCLRYLPSQAGVPLYYCSSNFCRSQAVRIIDCSPFSRRYRPRHHHALEGYSCFYLGFETIHVY